MKNISNLPIFAGHTMQLANLGDDPFHRKPTQPLVYETKQPETDPSPCLVDALRGARKELLRLFFSKTSKPPRQPISTPPQVQITERMEGSVIVISICGSIDLGTSSQLRACLQLKVAQRAQDILFDFASVTHIESTGLATLVEFLRNTRRFGGRLVLATLSSRVKNAFEILRLEQVFSIYSDQTSALTDLKLKRKEKSWLGNKGWAETRPAKNFFAGAMFLEGSAAR